MSYDLETLKQEFVEYQKKNKITQCQLELVKKLYQKYRCQQEHPKSLIEIVNECLHRKINQLNDITHSEIDTIIKYFNHQLFTLESKKKKLVHVENLDFDEISKILKKQIHTIDDLTRFDYYRLSTTPKYNFSYCLTHFNLKNQDCIIESHFEYEYGYQMSDLIDNGKLYYLKFYDFMMIDYDAIQLDDVISILENYYKDNDDILFYIYKTYNGYHLYYMSSLCSHVDKSTCFTMRNLHCDPWYILFSHKNGFKIRLSKKKDRNENLIQEFVTSWGNGKAHQKCLQYISILDHYMNRSNK